MGLFAYTVAGGGGILIGVWESVSSVAESIGKDSKLMASVYFPETVSREKPKATLFSSTTTYLLISVLSVLFIVNSLISLIDAIGSKDSMGFALQLQVITIALLFLLNSLLGFFSSAIPHSFHFPKKLLNLMDAFAFGEEFLLFYAHIKDPDGVENRYYDLLLVPIGICLFSTLLEMSSGKWKYARLGRGIGFILQGMWTVQMGFSFFSNLISDGCGLEEKSRGNFSVKCKGHPEYHRGSAIATLLFNCHLALLVALCIGFHAVVCKINGIGRGVIKYEPIRGGDMQVEDSHVQFTLESDDDEDDGGDRIKEDRSVEMQRTRLVGAIGYGSPPP